MRNPFTFRGFDTLIAKGTSLRIQTMWLGVGSTTVIDGDVHGPHGSSDGCAIAVSDSLPITDRTKPDLKTTIVVNGSLNLVNDINVPNIVITGQVAAGKIICEGTLAIKAGAKVVANEIQYRSLVIEDGAIVLGTMAHLDHVSAGEIL